jgi:arabinan endo-1,5-alpha-L-arabinosidase
MFQFLKPLLATVLAVAPFVQGYSNPGACTGACWAHDPAIAKRSDGTYFKFNTGVGIEIATASAIEGPWTLVGYVLPDGTSINGQTDLWVSSCVRLSLFSKLIEHTRLLMSVS